MIKRSAVPDAGNTLSGMLLLGIFLLVPLLIVLTVPAVPDILGNFTNLSKIVPVTGSTSGNTTEAMVQYTNWLNGMSASMLSFFNQIMSVFGMGNPALSGNSSDIQKTLQQVMNPANGSGLVP
jgi:hypothetical protein